jgi:hypothetical protein
MQRLSIRPSSGAGEPDLSGAHSSMRGDGLDFADIHPLIEKGTSLFERKRQGSQRDHARYSTAVVMNKPHAALAARYRGMSTLGTTHAFAFRSLAGRANAKSRRVAAMTWKFSAT